MLIQFGVSNWMSFKEKTVLSMVASKERSHGERLPYIKKYLMRLLPVSVVYGGNASGKTNFFKAFLFMKNMVLKGNPPDSAIPLDTFKMDTNFSNSPSGFFIELLLNEQAYRYEFSVDRIKVISETLTEINPASEKILFNRKDGQPNFHSSLSKEKDFLEFVFKGTRQNQLLLTNSVLQNSDIFKQVYDWFKNNLELIAPDSRFEPYHLFLNKENYLFKSMNKMLAGLDTGISRMEFIDIPLESTALPDFIKIKINEDLSEGEAVRIESVPNQNDRFIITRKDGQLIAKKLITVHQTKDGQEVKFEMKNESDGSKRVIDLLPAFLDASNNNNKLYIIDELDRSLHSLLTRQMLEFYLNSCNKTSKSQMLFTSHDLMLMDQKLFRRDEMWIAERSFSGESTLISFNEYKDVRYDKDVRKSYMQGRLGGIPRFLTSNLSLKSDCDSNE